MSHVVSRQVYQVLSRGEKNSMLDSTEKGLWLEIREVFLHQSMVTMRPQQEHCADLASLLRNDRLAMEAVRRDSPG